MAQTALPPFDPYLPLELTADVREKAHKLRIRQGGIQTLKFPLVDGCLEAEDKQTLADLVRRATGSYRIEILDGAGQPVVSQSYLPMDDRDRSEIESQTIINHDTTGIATMLLSVGKNNEATNRSLNNALETVVRSNEALAQEIRKGKSDIPNAIMSLLETYREDGEKARATLAKLQSELADARAALAAQGGQGGEMGREMIGLMRDLAAGKISPESKSGKSVIQQVAGSFLQSLLKGDTGILTELLKGITTVERIKIALQTMKSVVATLNDSEKIEAAAFWIQQLSPLIPSGEKTE